MIWVVERGLWWGASCCPTGGKELAVFACSSSCCCPPPPLLLKGLSVASSVRLTGFVLCSILSYQQGKEMAPFAGDVCINVGELIRSAMRLKMDTSSRMG